MSGSEAGAWFEPDTEGCLLVVGSFSYRASVVRPAVDEVSRLLLASPALSDFIGVEYADLGGLPEPDAVPGEAVGQVGRALSRHGGFADRNYFALAVIDRSATAVSAVLQACANDEYIGNLPANYLGIASFDDRDQAKKTADIDSGLKVTIAPDGSWHTPQLTTELHRHADYLMHDFAASDHKGMTTGRFREIRPDSYEAEEPEPRTAGGELAEANPEAPLVLSSPARGPESLPAPAADVAPALPPAPADEPLPVISALAPERRGLPRIPWPGSNARKAAATHPDPRVRAAGAVYLVLSSNEVTGELADWRRGKSVLLDLDRKLAAIPDCAFQVRAVQVTDDLTSDGLRPAGRLSRRDMKRPERTNLSRVLAAIDRALTSDLAACRRATGEVKRPAVIIFAADAPLADLATVEACTRLAGKADIRWMGPEKILTLLSPRFAQICGTTPILADEFAADEVLAEMAPSPHPEPTSADAEAAGGLSSPDPVKSPSRENPPAGTR